MKQSEIFAAYVKLAEGWREACERMQATLDKIVTAQYDRPMVQQAPPPADPMPQGMLWDQADVRPESEIERGINALNVGSDEEFLRSVQ